MAEVYVAQYKVWNKGKGEQVPEVEYPLSEDYPVGSPLFSLRFRLADQAVVKISKERFGNQWWGEEEQWGKAKERLLIQPWDRGGSLEILVVKGIWEGNPREVVRQIEELLDKVRRRNKQIEDLKDDLAAAKQR